MSKPIRVATICHNDDDRNDQNHRRVRLALIKEQDGSGYVWSDEEGNEAGNMGVHKTVYDAEIAAIQSWGADVWDLRATWRP